MSIHLARDSRAYLRGKLKALEADEAQEIELLRKREAGVVEELMERAQRAIDQDKWYRGPFLPRRDDISLTGMCSVHVQTARDTATQLDKLGYAARVGPDEHSELQAHVFLRDPLQDALTWGPSK